VLLHACEQLSLRIRPLIDVHLNCPRRRQRREGQRLSAGHDPVASRDAGNARSVERFRRSTARATRICGRVVEELQIARPGCSIVLRANGDLSGQWDIERLSQVLSNLLGNALEHGAPQTPIRVELSGDTDAVTIQVTNYGRTIAADALRALFEPLRAAAGTESSAKRGPGLGLYIVDPIVAAHGGTVAATSADGEGTRFTVRLPRTA
jgi:signal transduction histidine kinase